MIFIRSHIIDFGIVQTGKVYAYKKKDAFKMYTPEQLDPLRRWKFDLISYEEHLFERWFVDVL